LEVKAQNKGVKLVYEIDPAIIKYVYTDPERLKSIFINLVDNAIKFTIEGSVKVTMDLLKN